MKLILLIVFISLQSFASPHPGASTSILTDLNKGYFLKFHGFDIQLDSSDWGIKSNSKPMDYVFLLKKNLPQFTGQFSLKIFENTKKANLETNTKKWLKEYSQFGFEILGTKTFTQNNQKGVVIDLFQSSKIKQTRQIIFQNDKQLAIFTCQDTEKSFKNTLSLCNQLIKNFRWIEI